MVPSDLGLSGADPKPIVNKALRSWSDLKPSFRYGDLFLPGIISDGSLALIKYCYKCDCFNNISIQNNDVLDAAIIFGRTDIIEWCLSLDLTPSLIAVKKAVVMQHLEILNILRATSLVQIPVSTYTYGEYIWTRDSELNYFDIWSPEKMDWMINIEGVYPDAEGAKVGFKKCDFEVWKRLRNLQHVPSSKQVGQAIVEFDWSLSQIQELKIEPKMLSIEILNFMVEIGKLDWLKWAASKCCYPSQGEINRLQRRIYGYDTFSHLTNRYTGQRNKHPSHQSMIETLTWCFAIGRAPNWRVTWCAQEGKNEELSYWLKRKIYPSSEGVNEALFRNHIETLELLREHAFFPTSKAVNQICSDDRLPLLRQMVSWGIRPDSDGANCAAGRNSPKTLKISGRTRHKTNLPSL